MMTNLGIADSPEACSPSEQVIDAISSCLPAIGTGDFIERFMELVILTGAGQATAFAYEETKASCLISRNFMLEESSRTLADIYVDGWFHDDPVFARARTMREGDCAVSWLEDLLPYSNPQYFKTFFGEAGWRTKIAIMVRQDALRMALNLYFVGGVVRRSSLKPGCIDDSLYRLIGTMLATHLLKLNAPGFPLPLAVLSERERQVCIGMLAGKKAEIIAEEIGISASSVVTYRQRAYQKLGISSRGQLFSICRA